MTVSGAALGGILRKNCAPIPDFLIKMFVRRPERLIWAGRDAQEICRRRLLPGGSADFGRRLR
jgi:hypothetical protein